MGKPLKVLFVEDNPHDVALLERELRQGDYDVEFERVETRESMSAALALQPWDVILSDLSLPSFGGMQALAILKESHRDIPFIMVSGTLNDDIAVAAIHAGANDFIPKNNLARLVPAIERELHAFELRKEQKKMEEQLMVSDRMASMGTLAAGVAHEINNPLACVMTNLELATRDLAELADVHGLGGQLGDLRDELRDAREATERIRNIVRDLKIFSRSHEEQTGAVDVQHVMESTLRMAWNEIRHRARLVKNYARTPPVEASESRLGQVFLNLVMNAAQAIPEGRAEANEIRITTSNGRNGHVAVEVSDTGVGMSREVLSRLFSPFFTTKPVGVGTGLGLSICHRIVTGFGGTIEVHSQPGQGTTFRISLPPAQGEVSAVTPAAQSRSVARRRGRILGVDDEPLISKAIQRCLVNDHDVVALTRGAEALEKIRAGAEFDVILCDLMMPEMTGMELHA